jgi:hypothetical protein
MSLRLFWLCLLIVGGCSDPAWAAARTEPVVLQLTGLR